MLKYFSVIKYMALSWKNKNTDELAKAFLLLETPAEAKRFLRDLLTPEEIIEFGKRWQAARMLDRKIPYSQIEKETGLSSTTVARVSKWLKNGIDGYKLALRKLHHSTKSSKRKRC